MTFHTIIPRYQVETSNEQFQSPTKKQAEDIAKKKMKDLKFELIKSKANAAKTGGSKTKEIKKIIARIHTLNNSKGRLGNK